MKYSPRIDRLLHLPGKTHRIDMLLLVGKTAVEKTPPRGVFGGGGGKGYSCPLCPFFGYGYFCVEKYQVVISCKLIISDIFYSRWRKNWPNVYRPSNAEIGLTTSLQIFPLIYIFYLTFSRQATPPRLGPGVPVFQGTKGSRPKKSSTNGQAMKALPPPPLELNGHRNPFFFIVLK